MSDTLTTVVSIDIYTLLSVMDLSTKLNSGQASTELVK